MMRLTVLMASWLSVAGMSAGGLCAQEQQPAEPDPQEAPRFDRTQHMDALNALKAEANYSALAAEIDQPESGPEVMATMDWLKEQFVSGSSSFFSFKYSQSLSAVARNLPDEQGEQLSGTALAAMLYSVIAARAEGLQCADVSARAERSSRFINLLAQSGLLDEKPELRSQAAWVALAVERSTWPQRKAANDAKFLCMNGMSAMAAGLASGAVKEVETPEGLLGTTREVTVPEDFVYQRRADEEWWPEAEERRATNEELLKSLANIEEISPGGAQ